MEVVHDIDRHDIGTVKPLMQGIANKARAMLIGKLPYLNVHTDDNLCSSVWITGSLESREQWSNGILDNSPLFRFAIFAEKGRRYYKANEPITVELTRISHKLGKRPFRKYTGPVDKALSKIVAFIDALGVSVH